MKKIKVFLIKASVLAAVVAYILFGAGIEGTASLPACAVGMLACLGWMFIVAYANREDR